MQFPAAKKPRRCKPFFKEVTVFTYVLPSAVTIILAGLTLYMAWVANPSRVMRIGCNNGEQVYRHEILRCKTCKQFYAPIAGGVAFFGTHWFYMVPNMFKFAILGGFGFWVVICVVCALAAHDDQLGLTARLAERGIAV